MVHSLRQGTEEITRQNTRLSPAVPSCSPPKTAWAGKEISDQ